MVAETQVANYTDFGALTQLKARAGANDPQAVRAAAQQFEALFLQMMLKSMRSASSALAESRDRTYEEMFDQQIAIELAQRDSLGIGDLLLRQIDSLESASNELSAAAVPVGAVPTAAAGLSTRQRSDFRPDDASEFVADIWSHAKQTGRALGVDPRVIVAQAALETGWGSELIRDSNGISGNNLFGIKADGGWTGERIGVASLEYDGTRFAPQTSQFRAYDSLAEGFAGYREFLNGNSRYGDAIRNGGDPAQFARELQNAGYATDPNYAEKIEQIFHSSEFAELIHNAEGR